MGEDNFFEMSKESLQKVRFIHLEKKACHGESDNDKKCKEEKEPNKIIFPNDVIGFYSFGFFDSVKCIRPSNSSCLFNFKHHFAVSYPYNRNMNIKKVEQWFGLIPLNKKYQWGRLNKNLCNDIFFYYDLSKQNDITIKMPFVGIILISLNCYEKGKPDKTIENKVEFINKPHIAMLRDECNYLLKKYNSFQTPIERNDKDRIDFLFDLLNTYSEFSYDNVEYISYIITCLKYKSLFLAQFKRKNPYNTCQREILLSLEISHFEGVITALLHFIKSTIIYNKTLKSKKRIELQTAVKAARDISCIFGCYYYHIIIDALLNESGIDNS